VKKRVVLRARERGVFVRHRPPVKASFASKTGAGRWLANGLSIRGHHSPRTVPTSCASTAQLSISGDYTVSSCGNGHGAAPPMWSRLRRSMRRWRMRRPGTRQPQTGECRRTATLFDQSKASSTTLTSSGEQPDRRPQDRSGGRRHLVVVGGHPNSQISSARRLRAGHK